MKVEHIGIAVKSLSEAEKVFRSIFPDASYHECPLPEQELKTLIIDGGNTKIELIESTSENSTITKYIKNKGEGLHHIAFEVDDINTAMDKVRESDYRLLTEAPYRGVEDYLVCFLHPKDTNDVLVEFCQKP